MKDFAGKVAFITGGASGLGYGLAEVFSDAGCRIVIADIRQQAIDQAVQALKARGAEAHGIRLDVADRAAVRAAADEVETVFGEPPQLLFNNAGVNTFGPLEKSTDEDWDWVMGVDLWGVINGMQAFVPRMIAAGKGGHIVNTSSVGGFEGSAGAGVYCAAKAAVNNLSEGYRMALEKYGIGVTVCCPANIRSNIAEATKTRPERLKNTGYLVNEQTIESLRSIHVHGMEPVVLAGHVKRAVEDNRLYCIPYPEEKERLARRFEAILDAIPPVDTDPEGVRERIEALQNWAKDRARMFSTAKDEAER